MLFSLDVDVLYLDLSHYHHSPSAFVLTSHRVAGDVCRAQISASLQGQLL